MRLPHTCTQRPEYVPSPPISPQPNSSSPLPHTHYTRLPMRAAAPRPPFISGGSVSHAELTRATCWVWAHRISLKIGAGCLCLGSTSVGTAAKIKRLSPDRPKSGSEKTQRYDGLPGSHYVRWTLSAIIQALQNSQKCINRYQIYKGYIKDKKSLWRDIPQHRANLWWCV